MYLGFAPWGTELGDLVPLGLVLLQAPGIMWYVSTRGMAPRIDFEGVLFSGYAPDGGLYMPEELPQLGRETLREWSTLSYPSLVKELCSLFIGPELIPRDDLNGEHPSTFLLSHLTILPAQPPELQIHHLTPRRSLVVFPKLWSFSQTLKSQNWKNPERVSSILTPTPSVGNAKVIGGKCQSDWQRICF